MQYLLSTKQIHHGQPPFEHLRPASAPLFLRRRPPGNPPARETGRGLGHGEHTPAQPAARAQLPGGLSATYLGPCKGRRPSRTRGAGLEPSQIGSEDPGEEIVPFPVLGHETGITGQRLFPFARCLGTRTLRERPHWATVCRFGGQVTQSMCRYTHSPPITRSSEPPGRNSLGSPSARRRGLEGPAGSLRAPRLRRPFCMGCRYAGHEDSGFSVRGASASRRLFEGRPSPGGRVEQEAAPGGHLWGRQCGRWPSSPL